MGRGSKVTELQALWLAVGVLGAVVAVLVYETLTLYEQRRQLAARVGALAKASHEADQLLEAALGGVKAGVNNVRQLASQVHEKADDARAMAAKARRDADELDERLVAIEQQADGHVEVESLRARVDELERRTRTEVLVAAVLGAVGEAVRAYFEWAASQGQGKGESR
jgi:seryl-tRNA synthetase